MRSPTPGASARAARKRHVVGARGVTPSAASRTWIEPLERRLMLAATVVARHVFYNNSAFDGRTSGAHAADDAAIAAEKRVLLPGEKATFANYTGYSRGINGIMIDIQGLPAGTGPDVFDFGYLYADATEW